LADISKIDPDDPFPTYGLTLGVRVPDYEVKDRFWFSSHFEGAYLYHDSLIVAIKPAREGSADWDVRYDWQSENPGHATKELPFTLQSDGRIELTVEFKSDGAPGISGSLRFVVSPWND
jgi:hypothetical protein